MICILVDEAHQVSKDPSGLLHQQITVFGFLVETKLPVIDKPSIHKHVVFTKLGHC